MSANKAFQPKILRIDSRGDEYLSLIVHSIQTSFNFERASVQMLRLADMNYSKGLCAVNYEFVAS